MLSRKSMGKKREGPFSDRNLEMMDLNMEVNNMGGDCFGGRWGAKDGGVRNKNGGASGFGGAGAKEWEVSE